MKKQKISLIMLLFVVSILAAGCGKTESAQTENGSETLQSNKGNAEERMEGTDIINPISEIVSLEDGLSAVKYSGNYKLNEFLEQGGASSDADVMGFLTKHLFSGESVLEFFGSIFGCSALSVKSTDGSYIFGRNFDWNC